MSGAVDVLDRLNLLPGDVVECVEDHGNGNYTVGKRYTVTEYGKVVNDKGGTIHGVKSKFRAVIRANPPAGPVRTVMRKEIVHGVYGRISIEHGPDEDGDVYLKFADSEGSVDESEAAYCFDAAELRTAASVLIDIADALEAPTQ